MHAFSKLISIIYRSQKGLPQPKNFRERYSRSGSAATSNKYQSLRGSTILSRSGFSIARRFSYVQTAILFLGIGIVLSSSLILSGCARLAPVPGTELGELDKREVIKFLTTRDAEITTAKVLARVQIEHGEEREVFTYALAFDRPDNIRIDVLPIGSALSLLSAAISPNGSVLLNVQEKKAYKDKESRSSLRTVLRLPLSVEEASAYLVGVTPYRLLGEEPAIFRQSDSSFIVVKPDRSVEWSFDTESNLSSVILRRPHRASEEMSIRYGTYRVQDGFRVPSDLVITVPREDLKITLRIRSIQINSDIAPEIFELRVPEDFDLSNLPN